MARPPNSQQIVTHWQSHGFNFCQPTQQFQLAVAAKSQGSAGPSALMQSLGTPRKNALKYVDRGRIFLLRIHFTSFSVVEVVFFLSLLFFFRKDKNDGVLKLMGKSVLR